MSFSQLSMAVSTSELKRLAVTQKDTESQYLLGYRYEMGKTVKRSHKKAINWYKKAANKNHRDAQYRLGLLYYKKKQYQKARYWFAKRAKKGHADSQYHFANTYRYALGTKEKTTTARKWYQKAAKQGHAKAQYELGLQFQHGIGAKKNLKTAKKWFKLSAKKGYKKAKTSLAKLDTNKKESFKSKNLRLAKKGNAEAQYQLGYAYKTGKKIKKNLKKSFHWLNKASKQNHRQAQYELALTYLDGNSATRKNISKAKLLLTEAASKKHKHAKKKLNALEKISKQEQQTAKINSMIKSAQLNDRDQQYELGMRYLIGHQLEIDKLQAIHWLRKAAEQGHALAQYKIANQYMSGKNVNQDINKSIHYFVAASKQKIPEAQMVLKYFSENGYATNVKAEQGDANAQFQLASLYLKKENNTEKFKAIKWLISSAKQAQPQALYELGNLYQTGSLIEKDEVKAFAAFTKAAELDSADAQFQLSLMYKNGLGTSKDPALAARWLSRAASQGHEDAQKALQFSGI